MLPVGTPKRSVVLASLLGATLIAVAVALNISWIILNWRTGILLVVGVVSFAVLIVGLLLNTGFLVREIRRSERHDAFINVVTHELKTPLASIQLYLQTLQRRDVDPSQRQAFIEIMLADSDRLQSTIDQILLAGKMGATRRPVNQSDVDLRKLVADCVDVAGTRHHLSGEQLRFTTRIPDARAAIVTGDLDEIRAAVSNLIDNAVKYSDGVVDVIVELTKPGAHRLAIVVKDRGVGIDPAELPQVFRRFYRSPNLRGPTRKGTGLGLSIVAAVARRHGGRASADSEGAGRGSTFTLELPLKLS
jgi:signal transduction histidine kinase